MSLLNLLYKIRFTNKGLAQNTFEEKKISQCVEQYIEYFKKQSVYIFCLHRKVYRNA